MGSAYAAHGPRGRSNNPGKGGQSNVQLRGLGATSTLELLDGRRIIPANGNGAVSNLLGRRYSVSASYRF